MGLFGMSSKDEAKVKKTVDETVKKGKKVGEKVVARGKEIGKKVLKKGKELSNVAKIQAEIIKCKGLIEKEKYTIGNEVVKSGLPIPKNNEKINAALDKIEAYNKKILAKQAELKKAKK